MHLPGYVFVVCVATVSGNTQMSSYEHGAQFDKCIQISDWEDSTLATSIKLSDRVNNCCPQNTVPGMKHYAKYVSAQVVCGFESDGSVSFTAKSSGCSYNKCFVWKQDLPCADGTRQRLNGCCKKNDCKTNNCGFQSGCRNYAYGMKNAHNEDTSYCLTYNQKYKMEGTSSETDDIQSSKLNFNNLYRYTPCVGGGSGTGTGTGGTGEKCSKHQGSWIAAQILNGGCRKNGKMFFDLKKANVDLSSSASETEITNKCCTNFEDAKCWDWNLMGCTSGTLRSEPNRKTIAAKPDINSGLGLSQNKFNQLCCLSGNTGSTGGTTGGSTTSAKTCASYQTSWESAQYLNGGCAKSKSFFDKKKLSNEVAWPYGDAQISNVCCTKSSQATCNDWTGIYKCMVGSSAKPNPTTIKMAANYRIVWLTIDQFQTGCCVSNDVDGANQQGQLASGLAVAIGLISIMSRR